VTIETGEDVTQNIRTIRAQIPLRHRLMRPLCWRSAQRV
jgi:NAD-dependent DNA ligase